MKSPTLFLCAALLTACGTPPNPVRLTATVEDAENIAVAYCPFSADISAETPMIPAAQNGENEFLLPDDSTIYAVTVRFNNRPDQVRELILMPGERLILTGRLNIGTDDPAVVISGSELYQTLYREIEEVKSQTKSLSALMRRAQAGDKLTDNEQQQLDSLNAWSNNYIVERIRNHPESPTTAYYIMSRMFPDSCYNELYYGIPEEIRNGKYKQFYDLLRPAEVAKPQH